MQINITTLGCRLNEAELESWAQEFQARGHTLTNDPETADMLVVNTCAVTREAVRKSCQLLRRTHRHNPRARLVVSGCFASLDRKTVEDIEGVALVVDNRHKDELVEIALRELATETMPSLSTQPGETPLFFLGRHRGFIKIQDGCRHQCSFCIVTVARGEERSRSIQEIIHDIARLSEQGVKEVVLTGVHTGGYGSDRDTSLYRLIDAILNDTDIPRLRLASIEPWDLPGHFFTLYQNPRLMPHIHLPLQSGSESVLKRMARRGTTGDFERLIDRARSEVRDINITTDIIVGFPGETGKEWDESLEFIHNIGFSRIHIFPYSARLGTSASCLPDQVPQSTRKQRSDELHALSRQLGLAFMKRQIGSQCSVLWEAVRKKVDGEYFTGYTPNYVRVELAAPSGDNLDNQIRPVTITGITGTGKMMKAELS